MTGFPKTRAELFRYRAIILGNVEASFFTHDQLAMLADFVNVRGGGLLLLGGRRSFAEGGYAGTPLADVMPVVVTGDAVPDSLTFFADLKVALTPAGASHAVAQIGATPARVGGAVEDAAAGHDGEPHSRSEAGRGHADHRIDRAGRPRGRAGRAAAELRAAGARLSAVWSRAVGRVPDSGFVESGRWIPTRRRTTIRRSRVSGGRCCAG